MDADVIIIGGGLAGLVASNELVRAGKRVAILDQENAANLGGQAFWSLGGLFLVLRHPGHAQTAPHHPGPAAVQPLLVHPQSKDHRKGVRPLRLRAEPRHH